MQAPSTAGGGSWLPQTALHHHTVKPGRGKHSQIQSVEFSIGAEKAPVRGFRRGSVIKAQHRMTYRLSLNVGRPQTELHECDRCMPSALATLLQIVAVPAHLSCRYRGVPLITGAVAGA